MNEQIIELFGDKYQIVEEPDDYAGDTGDFCGECDLEKQCRAAQRHLSGHEIMCMDSNGIANRHFKLVDDSEG